MLWVVAAIVVYVVAVSVAVSVAYTRCFRAAFLESFRKHESSAVDTSKLQQSDERAMEPLGKREEGG